MKNVLEIGKIVNTHGLKGEVKVVSWTDAPDVFEDIEYVYADLRGEPVKLTVKNVRYQKNNLIVEFSELKSISEAEPLKNCVLSTDRSQLGELPEGKHFIADLLGSRVILSNGSSVGVLKDIFSTGSNDVYVIAREGQRDLLLPALDETVLNIDIDNSEITVDIMEGLEDL